jgi:hypothetical protein
MTAGQDPHDGSEADWVPFTLRLPKSMHEKLRWKAFLGGTTMSAIVRDDIEAGIARSGPVREAGSPGGISAQLAESP